jgi:hypothetical protein
LVANVKTVFIDNVPFKTGLSESDLAEAKNQITLAREMVKDFPSVHVGLKTCGPEVELNFQKVIAKIKKSILCSAIAANKRLPAEKRATLEQCLKVPCLLNFDSRLSEPVPVYPKASTACET